MEEMESIDKKNICRLCLLSGEDLTYIFEVNVRNGFVAADLIKDLLQFKVSKADSYPHVICPTCLSKLTDFQYFKEQCQTSKVTYDNVFDSNEGFVDNPHISDPLELNVKKEILDETVDKDLQMQDPVHEIKPESVDIVEDVQPQDFLEEVKSESVDIVEYEDDDSQFEEITEENNLEDPLGRDDLQSETGITCMKKDTSMKWTEETMLLAVNSVIHEHNGIRQAAGFFKVPVSTLQGRVQRMRLRKTSGTQDEDSEKMERAYLKRDTALKWTEETMLQAVNSVIHEHNGVRRAANFFKVPISTLRGRIKKMMAKQVLGTEDQDLYKDCDVPTVIDLSDEEGTSAELPYSCDHCDRQFSQRDGLAMHAALHAGDQPYFCVVCNMRFVLRSDLSAHMGMHGETELQGCDDGRLIEKHQLERQQQRPPPSGKMPYGCNECGNSYKHRESLIRHMRKHKMEAIISEGGLEATLGGESSQSQMEEGDAGNRLQDTLGREDLPSQMEADAGEHSSKDSLGREELPSQMEADAGEDNSEDSEELQSRDLTGYVKVEPVDAEEDLDRHSQEASPVVPMKLIQVLNFNDPLSKDRILPAVASSAEGAEGTSNSRAEGSGTRNGYNYRALYSRWNWLKQRVEMKKRFHCNLCRKRFRCKTGLAQHHMLHTGEKPHVCPHCGNRFTLMSTLKSHVRIHSEERPYACQLCTRRFMKEHLFAAHMKNHYDEHRYGCDQCGKLFRLKQLLKQHMKTHLFRCERCQKSYKYKISLDSHMKKHMERDDPLPTISVGEIWIESRGIKEEPVETEPLDDDEKDQPEGESGSSSLAATSLFITTSN